MPDHLGPVDIPEPLLIDDFPLQVDYGTSTVLEDRVVAHLMDQPGLKAEQRFYMGDGARRFIIRKSHLTCDEYETLKTHWESAQGVYAEFDYTYPNPDIGTRLCHYADTSISFEHLVAMLVGDPGIVLREAHHEEVALPVTTTLERFPDTDLTLHLRQEVQRVVPLVTITPRGTDPIPLYLSDRRCNSETKLYLPRLLSWSGISQSIGENQDEAQFTFGNADEIWYEYTKQIDLYRAEILFSLYFYGIETRLNLWKGYLTSQRFEENESFVVSASDGIYELNLLYPTRQIARTCWKDFADGVWCPYGTGATNPDTGLAWPDDPDTGEPFTECPKDYSACVARGMERRFGGQDCKAQTISIKNNTTGTWGFGRSAITSVTVRNDTIYQRVLQEVYNDTVRKTRNEAGDIIDAPPPQGTTLGMPVPCDIAAGRDESEFYAAIGVVGEGPIGEYHIDNARHKLDNHMPHERTLPGGGSGGFRGVRGFDPADATHDWFQISQLQNHPTTGQPTWNLPPPNTTWAAGTAFAEIKREDEPGLQLEPITGHEIIVTVDKGLGGWIWTGDPPARDWAPALTNPIWIAVNMYLRALGLKADPSHADVITSAEMEATFDVQEAIDAAAIANDVVPVMVPAEEGGHEIQFPFRGTIREQKPLRDWLQEVLNTCLGFYTFVMGKLRLGIKVNSSVPAGGAFTRANVLHRSVRTEPVVAGFNYLTAEFGDEEFEWQLNRVVIYDIEHAKFFGKPTAPRYTQSQMSLVGVSSKSQAARIITTRLREELGGTTRQEQQDARHVRLKTTIMALSIYPGQICSLDHPNLPNERVEFRVMRWRLNPDWSIDIEGSSTCDSMYDYVIGPKPEDVLADPVPPEHFPAAIGTAWLPNEEAPAPFDPMYPPTELTFAVRQDYLSLEAEGTYAPLIWVRGELAINKFIQGDAPAIRGAKRFTTGGSLPGGRTYYFVVAQRDGAPVPADTDTPGGHFVYLSNYSAIWIPEGTNTNRILLEPIQTRQAMPGYALWAGDNVLALSQQTSDHDTPLPASIEITGPLTVRTRGLPSPQAKRVRIKAREVWHSGVAGIQVMGVIAPDKIQTNEIIGSDDPWVGQILSVIADASDGAVPLWNFQISFFDPVAGVFTVFPNCVIPGDPDNSVQEGDVMIIRSRATSWTDTTITNTLWANDVGTAQFDASAGLGINHEVGMTLMIIAGTGKGQVREIISNDHLTHTIKPKWRVTPDATSVYIVTLSDWPYAAESAVVDVSAENQRAEIALSINNSPNQTILVGGFLVDNLDRETREEVACYRDIYMYGEPYQVRTTVTADDDVKLTDQTIRVDTTDGDVDVNLLPVQSYFGRKLLVVNDGTGASPGQAIIHPFEGEEFQTGDATIILENPGEWAEFVAAGDRTETVPEAGFRYYNRRVPTWREARLRHWLRQPARARRRGHAPMPPPKRFGQL